jgi:methyl-accepting chemotaxis protein
MGFATRKNYRLFLYVNTLVIIFFGAVFAGWGLFWTVPAGLGEGYHAVQATVRGIAQVLFWRVAVLYAAISLLILLAMAVLHLFYSHRIAGPAYRMGREAARIAQGDLTGNITFRRKDNLTDMADSLNEVASQYQRRMEAVKNHLAAVETQSQLVSDVIQRGEDGAALKRAAEEITINVKKIESGLSELRT